MLTAPQDSAVAIANPAATGARAGAVTAALLCFAAVMVRVTVYACFLPEVRAVWLRSLIITIPWAAVAAVAGGLAGRIAARAKHVWSATLIGIAFFVPVAIAYVLMPLLSRIRPSELFPDFLVRMLLLAGSIGAVTGAVAWRFACHRRDPATVRLWQVSLLELVLFVAAVAAYLASFSSEVPRMVAWARAIGN